MTVRERQSPVQTSVQAGLDREPIIQASGLTKRFRRAVKGNGLMGALTHLVRPEYAEITAVDGVSLEIMPGKSVAYVGPNGAGKSTTVKLLTGILVPTAGEISVCGLTPFDNRIQNARNIGVVFGQRTQLWWDIPVQESFRLLGDIYEIPDVAFRTNFGELVDVLDLSPLLSVPARQLSLGQRMRCDLAASLIHMPRVLFLDEPTIGLDVSAVGAMRRFIAAYARETGATILLTSHYMADVETLCPRIVLIDRGKLRYDGPLSTLSTTLSPWKLLNVEVATGTGAAWDRFGEVTESTAERASIRVHREQVPAVTARVLAELPVADLSVTDPPLESVMDRVYREGLA